MCPAVACAIPCCNGPPLWLQIGIVYTELGKSSGQGTLRWDNFRYTEYAETVTNAIPVEERSLHVIIYLYFNAGDMIVGSENLKKIWSFEAGTAVLLIY